MRTYEARSIHRVVKIGNALWISIPRDLVRELGVLRREYCCVQRAPGRALLFTFPEASDGYPRTLRTPATGPHPSAGETKPHKH